MKPKEPADPLPQVEAENKTTELSAGGAQNV